MIRCVIFDFDGTLAQSNAIKRDAYYQAALALGDCGGIVDRALAAETGDREKVCAEIVRRVEREGLLPGSRSNSVWVTQLVGSYSDYCEKGIAACPEVPGAGLALKTLRERGYPLFINSATLQDALERVVSLRGMQAYFKGIYGSPGGKVENLEKIMRAEGIGPDNVAFVGDNEVDRAAARETGCHFLGLENEFSGYLSPPGLILNDLSGLPEVVENLVSRAFKVPGEKA